ncbi:hypothetical protein XELAEV_18038745mg [Xenopus laevis]|uniref:Uncharacterized protein n=1 Tax=Xenopus laevis TaxID=8355 RepID=A0A974C6I8_XENLA|nr:hypothetical protein XELAEV_18038745mg [Xenopus laevis]
MHFRQYMGQSPADICLLAGSELLTMKAPGQENFSGFCLPEADTPPLAKITCPLKGCRLACVTSKLCPHYKAQWAALDPHSDKF